MENNKILNAAFAYKAVGHQVVPDHPLKKYPFGFKNWQTKEFTDEELTDCILKKGYGIGIKNQEGLDFDNHGASEARRVIKEWKNLVDITNPGLVDRLLTEKTQHGGFHVAWKCKVIEDSQKLASRLPTAEELQKDPKIKEVVLIETRGLGGQFVVSPTPGYTIIRGDWCNLPQITPEERSVLLQCAKALDQMPKTPENGNASVSGNKNECERPGDIYNQRGHEEALELLKENGWEVVYEKESAKYLRRPGKYKGVSATYGYIAPGIFYNFTSSGDPFEVGHAYSPFAVLALLRHGGDYSQAAKELAKKYGIETTKVNADGELKERRTDTSNAEKINELFGNNIRFDHRRKRWLMWQGHRWKPDVDGFINRLAIKASRKRYEEATEIEDLAKRTSASKWAIASESKMRLDAAIGIAKNLLPISDSGDNWDADSMLLSCPNGIVDLTTGTLRDGKPEDRITMSTAVNFDSNAVCPLWEKFISEVFEDNEELIHYVKKSLGYSISGDIKEQVVFFCFGVGANGKSVLFSTIREIMKDYAYSAPMLMFQRNTMNTSSNDVASIEFKRFLMSSEILSSTKINELRLKKWSGGDQETARYLYSEFFSFYPVCKIWLFVNHKPQVEDDSFGFWRRMRLIPFNRVFKLSEQDKDLSQKLRGEFLGILNWLVKGCLLWQKEGLLPLPEIISEATGAYQQENDDLAEFVADACVESDGIVTKASVLYTAYKEWAEEQKLTGKDLFSKTAFGRRMGDKFPKIRVKAGICYRGIGIKTELTNPNGVGLYVGLTPKRRVGTQNTKTPIYESNQDSLLKNTSNPTYPTPDDDAVLDPSSFFDGNLPSSPVGDHSKTLEEL